MCCTINPEKRTLRIKVIKVLDLNTRHCLSKGAKIMKWERKLAQSIVTIVLQALVARLVYHLFAKKQPKETTKSND